MALNSFVAIQNEVLQFGFNDGPQINRARIKNFINETQYEIARDVEGPEFQQNATIQLVVGTYIYALPALFARAQDIAYPAENTRLQPVDIQDFDLSSSTTVNGLPMLYTFDQSNLFLYPNPTSPDQLVMRYISVPPEMVNDTDVPVLNPNYVRLLVYGALIRSYEGEDDTELAQYYSTQYSAILAKYKTDVLHRDADKPRQLAGTWSTGSGYSW